MKCRNGHSELVALREERKSTPVYQVSESDQGRRIRSSGGEQKKRKKKRMKRMKMEDKEAEVEEEVLARQPAAAIRSFEWRA